MDHYAMDLYDLYDLTGLDKDGAGVVTIYHVGGAVTREVRHPSPGVSPSNGDYERVVATAPPAPPATSSSEVTIASQAPDPAAISTPPRPYIESEVAKTATIQLNDDSNDGPQAATRWRRRSGLPEQSLLPPKRPKWESFTVRPKSLKLHRDGKARSYTLRTGHWTNVDDDTPLRGRIDLSSIVEVVVQPSIGYPICLPLKPNGCLLTGKYGEDNRGILTLGPRQTRAMIRARGHKFVGSLKYVER